MQTDTVIEAAGRRRWVDLYAPVVAAMLGVIGIDQLTKWWATGLTDCAEMNPRPIVGFCRAYNEGMAFSIGWGSGALIAVVAITIVVVLFVSARNMPLPARIVMGAICGGAAGNLIDRAIREPAPGSTNNGFMSGAVVDFIYTKFFATFNVADSAVVVGAFLLIILIWRMPEDDATDPQP